MDKKSNSWSWVCFEGCCVRNEGFCAFWLVLFLNTKIVITFSVDSTFRVSVRFQNEGYRVYFQRWMGIFQISRSFSWSSRTFQGPLLLIKLLIIRSSFYWSLSPFYHDFLFCVRTFKLFSITRALFTFFAFGRSHFQISRSLIF